MDIAIVGLAFLAGFLVVFGINALLADIQIHRQEEMRDRLHEEQRVLQQQRARAAMAHRNLKELAEGAGSKEEPKSIQERLNIFLEQAGSRTTAAQLVLMSLLLAIVTAMVSYLPTLNILMSLAAALVAGALPFAYLAHLRAQRLSKLRIQLADGFDLMSRTIRAGQTFSQSLQAIADEASPPMAEEFGYCYDQQNLGMSVEAAMRDLARRTGLLEIRIFVLAVLIHRQTGGNLSELLDKLSIVIRDRYRIQGLIRGLTAEGKMQALVLLALPVGMFFLILVTNREYAMTLFDYPWLIVTTLISMGIGAFFIRRIINFDH